MVSISAFTGLRPKPELAAQVASPPYDVISSEEARAQAAGNDLSFLHVVKPEIDLPVDCDLYGEDVYRMGADNLKKMVAQGTLLREDVPAMYIYRQTWRGHSQTGLVACSAVDDYDEDRIKKHEFTRPDKEDDRTRHVDSHGAHAGPVFLTYRGQAGIDALIEEHTKTAPTYDFTAEEVQHTLWVVTDQAWIDKVIAAFEQVPALYVADGHHRAASASRVRALRKERNSAHDGTEEYNRFLTVMFPDEQLRILPYNRLILDVGELSDEQIMAQLRETFELEPTDVQEPPRPHQVVMYLAGKWYLLSAKEGSYDAEDPVGVLDVAILQKNALEKVFGIADPRTDKRIAFVGGIRGTGYLQEQVDAGKARLAFVMYATSIAELLSVADAGLTMPPKSTWFEPKLRSGLIVHEF